ncbi:MAG: signal peptidase I [Erysipelotrichaceae bacterium]|nr:signal peptidase I [Erysipelotrichaceae bacterium]
MSEIEIIGLIVSILGVGSFATLFTVLYASYCKSAIIEYKTGKRDIEIIDEKIHDNLQHVKKHRKIIKTIKSIGFYGLMVIIIPFFIVALVNKFTGHVTMINDTGILVVATGSMSEKHEVNDYLIKNNLNNQFNAYEIIVIEKVDSDNDLKPFDVISYINDEGKNVIHRIVEIKHTSTGIQYVTRGDSNNANDTYHPTLKDIQGKYTGQHIPYIGVFVLFMQSNIGVITIVSLIYCLLMTDRYSAKITKAQDERLKILSEVIDFTSETQKGIMEAKYVENIYYRGFIYTFNELGFIEKKELVDGPYLEESNTSIIKVIDDGREKKIVSKEVIDKKEDEVKGGK